MHPWLRALACSLLIAVSVSCNNGGGGGGGGLLDHGACDLLIECATELAPESRDEYIAAYGDTGTCWQSGPSAWPACRDFCRMSLDALNLAMLGGETCGTCQIDADCAAYGPGASCDAGLCLGGGDMQSDGETGDSGMQSGSESDSGDGDGDGDGDGEGDGDGDTGPDCTPGALNCICDENGECIEGLACVDGMCTFDNSCTPGTLDCECDDGTCMAGLECVDGMCEQPDLPPGPFENCGWDADNGWNACGFSVENPQFPVECADESVLITGEVCPRGVTIAGCCDTNGDNWWCEGGVIAYDDCPPG
jgi:hypothetical protein